MVNRLRCVGEGEAVQQDHEEDQDIDNDRHACNGDVAYSCSMDPYISTVQYSICSHFSFHFISFLQTRHMVLGGDSVSLCCLVVFTHTHNCEVIFFQLDVQSSLILHIHPYIRTPRGTPSSRCLYFFTLYQS